MLTNLLFFFFYLKGTKAACFGHFLWPISWDLHQYELKYVSFSFFFLSFSFLFYLFFNFTILYWFCHISTWIRHRYTRVPHPEPSSPLLPCTIPLGCPSAPAPSIQYLALNLSCAKCIISPVIRTQDRFGGKSPPPWQRVNVTWLF